MFNNNRIFFKIILLIMLKLLQDLEIWLLDTCQKLYSNLCTFFLCTRHRQTLFGEVWGRSAACFWQDPHSMCITVLTMTLSKNNPREAQFSPAAPATKFWKRYISIASDKSLSTISGDICNLFILSKRGVLRWGWVFLERTRILNGIQFTTHFIEFLVVGTKRFVCSTVNVILTRQTCGQRSSRAAESKRRALETYISERNW